MISSYTNWTYLRFAMTSVAYKNNLYVMGGYDKDGSICDDLFMLDTGFNSSHSPPLLPPLFFPFMAFLSPLFLLSLYSFHITYALCLRLIKLLEKKEWQKINIHGTPPPARMYHSTVCLDNVCIGKRGGKRKDRERGGGKVGRM